MRIYEVMAMFDNEVGSAPLGLHATETGAKNHAERVRKNPEIMRTLGLVTVFHRACYVDNDAVEHHVEQLLKAGVTIDLVKFLQAFDVWAEDPSEDEVGDKMRDMMEARSQLRRSM